MTEMTNASMSMADENIKRIDFYYTRMCSCYRAVRDLDVQAIKPLVDDAILIWVQIYNKVKLINEQLYDKIKTHIRECENISRTRIETYNIKQQYEILDKITDLVEYMTEATDCIGIGIKVRAK